jgi:hypothetical protein
MNNCVLSDEELMFMAKLFDQNDEDKKILILNTIHDLVGDFLRYDRKEDEYLPISLAQQSLNGVNPAKIAKIAQKKADELAAETVTYPYTNAGTYLYPYTNKTKLDEISNKELLDKRKSK